MFSIQWFDLDFEGGRLRVINGMASEEEAIAHAGDLDVAGYEVIPTSEVPVDRTFRNAWRKGLGKIDIDLPEAKLIAHGMRRAERDGLFAPLDVEVTIPSKAIAAEAARQVIRDADDAKQVAIDGAADEAELKQLMVDNGLV